MAFYPRTNFAKANLTGILPTDVATEITLETGKGALFPDADVDGAFPAVLWNWTDYPDPSDDPAREIVLVTGVAGDILTITRAQEGTIASAHNTAGKTYRIALVPTAGVIQQIIDAIPSYLDITDNDFTQSDYYYYGGTDSNGVYKINRHNLTDGSLTQSTGDWADRYSLTYT